MILPSPELPLCALCDLVVKFPSPQFPLFAPVEESYLRDILCDVNGFGEDITSRHCPMVAGPSKTTSRHGLEIVTGASNGTVVVGSRPIVPPAGTFWTASSNV